MRAESLITEWLAVLCGLSPGTRQAMVFLAPGPGEPEPRRIVWPEGSSAPAGLDALATAALSGDEPVEQSVGESGDGPGGRGLRVAHPLPRSLGCRGAVALELSDVKPEALLLVRERLRTGAEWLALLTRQTRPSERLAHGLELMARALERERLVDAAREVATDAAQRFQCERVAIGRMRRGQIELLALSHAASFDPRSNRARDIVSAMEEACDQDALIAAPPPPGLAERVAIEHERLVAQHGLRASCSVPLAAGGGVIGALHLEWSDQSGPPSPAALACCEDAGALLGPLFARIEAADASAFARLVAGARGALRRLLEPRQMAAKLAVGVALLIGLALLAAPAPHRIGADASLEGRVRRAVVAGVDGFLAEVVARPGDEVRAGQVLARLDKQDLELELQSLLARREQTRSEHREASAQHDLARMSILSAQLAQVQAEIDLLAVNLERTELVAPFDGIVVRGDPSQQVGAPVERGEVLYELAPLDGYRIVLEVEERDVQWVREGQRGQLALAALPGRPRALVVERVTPVAVVEDGRNVFRVEAALEAADPRLRPGMEGVAKIEAGEARRLWLWTHDPFARLRLWLWSWWY